MQNQDQAIMEKYMIKEPIDFEAGQPVRIISKHDITGSYDMFRGKTVDVVLYQHNDVFFITDEQIAPIHRQFYSSRFDVTEFMKRRQCFACLFSEWDKCTCKTLSIIN